MHPRNNVRKKLKSEKTNEQYNHVPHDLRLRNTLKPYF